MLVLRLMIHQAAPSNDVLNFIAQHWPRDTGRLIHKAASAYKLTREHPGIGTADPTFQFWVSLGKAIAAE